MEAFMSVVIFATISQVIVERIKPLFIGNLAKYFVAEYVSLVVSVLLCVLFHVDIFQALDLTIFAPAIISYVLTGLIITGGAGLVNDIFKTVQGIKINKQPETTEVVLTEDTTLTKG